MRSQEQMIALNRNQAEFYNKIQEAEELVDSRGYAHNEDANVMTRIWAALRYQQQHAVRTSGIRDQVRQLHLDWTAEKAGGNFLEVGCFSGSPYTFDLIDAAGTYSGIELSAAACSSLRKKIEEKGQTEKASVICGDFLEFEPERKFDFIYAHGVLHHFENPMPLFAKLRRLIAPDGLLVFVEPVAINPIYRLLRSAYRPFQSDKDWEWPFQKNTVAELSQRFDIVGGFGWGKFSAPLTLLCGIPVFGSMILPAYRSIARREVAAGLQGGVLAEFDGGREMSGKGMSHRR